MTKHTEPHFESHGEILARLFPHLITKPGQVLTLTFQVTEDCCMACTYCYQNNKSKNKMSFETAKTIIDNLLNDDSCYHTEEVQALIIEFIGGEPLLEIDLIQQTMDYFMGEGIRLNHRFLKYFMISISSNGLLYFDEKVQNFLKKYKNNLSLTISIDGNKQLHDVCRIDLNGNGTYDRAIAAELHYHKTYSKSLETKMTISPYNVDYIFDAIKNLIGLGYISISLNCVYEEGWEIKHARTLYQQLKKVADWLFESDAFKKYRISMFNEKMFHPKADTDTQNWCGGVCNGMLSFDYKGDAYPCIRYMGSSLNNQQTPFSIGNVRGLYKSPVEKERYELLTSITRQSQSSEECLQCPVAEGCGWCSAYNYECFGTPNKRATFFCWTHKARSLASAYYYNKGYALSEEDTRVKIYLPKEDALKIISEEEWEELKRYEQI